MNHSRIVAILLTTAMWGAVSSCATSVPVPCPQYLPGQQVGTVALANINEASGMAMSRKNADVLWVHNDSGDSARVFAMNSGGTHLGIYNIVGAGAVDWEDMAIGPGPVGGENYLYLGDIGDNGAGRSSVKVYRIPEPTVSSSQSPVNVNLGGADSITLAYPDGARDAETLMVDPLNGDIYVVSKREAKSRVYRAAYPQATTATITMEFLGEMTWGWTTGGEISPTGREIIIRGNSSAFIWSRPPGSSVGDVLAADGCAVPLVWEPQGEAICFDGDGIDYFTVSEGTNRPIYRFERIPEPSALFLLAPGFLGFAGVLRRRLR